MSYRIRDAQPGMVGLVAGTHPELLGAAIDCVTLSRYHHAFLVGEGVIIEATWPTVRTTALETYANSADLFTVACTPEQRRMAVAHAHARVGDPYSIEELLVDGARDLLHLPLVWRWNAKALTCSAFVNAVYREAGVPLTWAVAPSPQDLWNSPLLIGPRS